MQSHVHILKFTTWRFMCRDSPIQVNSVEETQGKALTGPKHRCSLPPWSLGCATPPTTQMCSPALSSLEHVWLRAFIGALLQKHDWLSHWQMVINATSNTSPSSKVVGGSGWKVQRSDHVIGSPGNQCPFLGAFQNNGMNIISGVVERGFLMNK